MMTPFARSRRFESIFAAFALLVVFSSIPSVADAAEPKLADYPPYVMLLMDNSGSMSWTKKGDETYPEDDSVGVSCENSYSKSTNAYNKYIPTDTCACEWGVDNGTQPDVADGGDGPRRFGPCYVWEPECSSSNDQYTRPPPVVQTCTSSSSCVINTSPPATVNCHREDSDGDTRSVGFCRFGHIEDEDMRDRLVEMINSDNRLPAVGSQGAHRLTEYQSLLTGKKSLGDEDSSAGPGCWIIPRNPSNNAPNCDPDSAYYDFPDHRAGMPLIQPVWDKQQNKEGLLEKYKYTSIFSAYVMDSYTDKGPSYDPANPISNDWSPESELNDGMGADPYSADENSDDNYDMGIHQVFSATDLIEAGKNVSSNVSATGDAVKDLGWLDQGCSGSYTAPTAPECPFGYCGSDGTCEPYNADPPDWGQYHFGETPVASATPIAPMIHDTRQYHEDSGSPNQVIENDTFDECRPKHGIVLTDGVPAPEKAWCSSLDTTLKAAYAYPELANKNFDPWDPPKYTYQKAEKAVNDLVTESNLEVSSEGYRYDPRIHAIGMGVDYPDNKHVSEKLVLFKMVKMAIEGNTCAGYYLPELVPESSSELCDDTHPELDCGCNPANEICLDPDQADLFSNSGPYDLGDAPEYTPPKKVDGGAASTVTCKYPALVLDTELSESELEKDDRLYHPRLNKLFRHISVTSGIKNDTAPDYINQVDEPGLGNASKHSGGQVRLHPGLSVDRKSNYWKGMMFRTVQRCEVSGGEAKPGSSHTFATHSRMRNLFCPPADNTAFDVGGCVNDALSNNNGSGSDGDMEGDRRRIFTSVPKSSSYNYAKLRANPGQDDQERFINDFTPASNSDDKGEFGTSHLDEGVSNLDNSGNLVDRRIPVMNQTLFGDSGIYDDTGGDSCVLKYLEDGVKKLKSNLDCTANPPDTLTKQVIFDRLRARVSDRKNRPLGGIHNASPVAVGPPSADIPIDSYDEFKQRHDARPGMMYVNTTDGLLHAIYTGGLTPDKPGGSINPADQVKIRKNIVEPSAAGSADVRDGKLYEQREAWAYFPQFLHHRLDDKFAGARQFEPGLNSGTPVVKDVRLCHGTPDFNHNTQACDVIESTSSEVVAPEQQWRTVLVSGVGSPGKRAMEAGNSEIQTGYFALDVTRPGGDLIGDGTIRRPDPIPLWEFDRGWEYGQVKWLKGSHQSLIEAQVKSTGDFCTTSCNATEAYQNAYLGTSTGRPAIGTVMVNHDFDATSANLRRPIALISGGSQGTTPGNKYSQSKWDKDRIGGAVYVLDMQTGTIIRRFIDYRDNPDKSSGGLLKNMVGTPVFASSNPGEVSTRAFVSDAKGRLFKIHFSDPNAASPDPTDPANWELTLYFDPTDGDTIDQPDDNYSAPTAVESGMYGYEPTIVRGADQKLRIIHAFQTEAGGLRIVSLIDQGTDKPEFSWSIKMKGNSVQPHDDFPPEVTSEPVVFNQNVYFATYTHGSNGNACDPQPRIWGVTLEEAGADNETGEPDEAFTCESSMSYCEGGASDDDKIHWYEPSTSERIRGLEVRTPPACSFDPSDNDIPEASPNQSPQLVATTSGSPDPDSGSNKANEQSSSDAPGEVISIEDSIGEVKKSLQPFSWTVIKQ